MTSTPTREELAAEINVAMTREEILATILAGACSCSKAIETGCRMCIRNQRAHASLKHEFALFPHLKTPRLEHSHLELRGGAWTPRRSDEPEPLEANEPSAVVVYTTEPSPETGHVGWCWWALGAMGDAKTPSDAMAAAEAALKARAEGA